MAFIYIRVSESNVSNTNTVNTPVIKQNVNTSLNTNTVTANTNTAAQSTTEQEITSLSRSFIERFGTFSNQNDYENINNIRVYMTQNMEKQADKIIAEGEKNSNPNNPYYGITTKALSTKILKQETNDATVRVSTQRKESKEGEGEIKILYQDIDVVLKIDGGVWKVDSVQWL